MIGTSFDDELFKDKSRAETTVLRHTKTYSKVAFTYSCTSLSWQQVLYKSFITNFNKRYLSRGLTQSLGENKSGKGLRHWPSHRWCWSTHLNLCQRDWISGARLVRKSGSCNRLGCWFEKTRKSCIQFYDLEKLGFIIDQTWVNKCYV